MSTVFLDLDGTLTDPKIGITKSFIYALEKLDLPVPHMDELEWVIGPSLMDSFTRMQVPDPQVAIDLYRERYTSVGLLENSLYSGIIPALEQLQGADYRMFLATAKPHAYARKITAHFGLTPFLEHEFGPELDGTRNNKGDLLAHALDLTGIDPALSVMVGDRHHDYDAARAVGMKAIAVTWGYGSAEEWATADAVCETPQELLSVVQGLLS
ncbi:HAD hydrolase-like protein [Profundibacter sp.]|uniref:HAD hydrolase-like protein n=1 Tax=Profundibacter sp. TaxID=3101071 RepID=UPI003D0BED44